MRLTALLTVACVLLAGAAFATPYSMTIYAGPGGSTGENWISLPGVPLPVTTASGIPGNPADLFGDVAKIDDSRLVRLNAPTGGLEGYLSFQEPGGPFGNMLLGDGYRILNDTTADYTLSYEGVADGVPDAGGAMTDMWISLPGMTGANGGEHWIGHPYSHTTNWETNVKVTDGTKTIPVFDRDTDLTNDAVSLGWVDLYWAYMNNAAGGLEQVDPDGIVGSTDMLPGCCYVVNTHKSNIALIISAN